MATKSSSSKAAAPAPKAVAPAPKLASAASAAAAANASMAANKATIAANAAKGNTSAQNVVNKTTTGTPAPIGGSGSGGTVTIGGKVFDAGYVTTQAANNSAVANALKTSGNVTSYTAANGVTKNVTPGSVNTGSGTGTNNTPTQINTPTQTNTNKGTGSADTSGTSVTGTNVNNNNANNNQIMQNNLNSNYSNYKFGVNASSNQGDRDVRDMQLTAELKGKGITDANSIFNELSKNPDFASASNADKIATANKLAAGMGPTQSPAANATIQGAQDDKTHNDTQTGNLNDTYQTHQQNQSNIDNQSFNSQNSILNDRMNNVKDTFADVDKQIAELQRQSETLYNTQASQQATAQAKQMADAGFITSEDVAGQAQSIQADYHHQVDLKKADLQQQLTQKKIDLLQQKQKDIDGIMSAQGATEEQKRQAAIEIEKGYQTIADHIDDKMKQNDVNFQNIKNQQLGNQAQTEFGANQMLTQDTISKQITDQNRQDMLTNPTRRLKGVADFLKDTLNIDPAFSAPVIKGLINSGKFYNDANIDQQIMTIAQAANAAKVKASKSSGGGTQILSPTVAQASAGGAK